MNTKDRLTACLFLTLLFTTAAAAQKYNVTDLATVSGFSSSHAYDNNNPGQATGCVDNSVFPAVPCSDSSIPADPFLWSSGTMQDLGNLPGFDSAPDTSSMIRERWLVTPEIHRPGISTASTGVRVPGWLTWKP